MMERNSDVTADVVAQIEGRDDETEPRTVSDRAKAMPERLRVIVLRGPDEGEEREFGAEGCVVGHASDCDLTLNDPFVSRRHLRIRVRSHELEISDLGSRNGSYFAHGRFERIHAGLDCVVTIGGTTLRVSTAQERQPDVVHFGELVATSQSMRTAIERLQRVAGTDLPALLEGETGTGKELAVRAVHDASPRKSGPFVVCDLAAASLNLIESDLFGHVRGAFTGATHDRRGAFEQADGGTIFLDEIGELDAVLQPRLLRALEAHEVKPVGGSAYRRVDVRVIAATNRDLKEEVRTGRFRSDLYHRLSATQVHLPPLRDRRDDIPLLAHHMVLHATSSSTASPPAVSGEAMAALLAYHWPGNVRELRNVIERACTLASPFGLLDVTALELGEVETSAPSATDLETPFKEAKDRLIRIWERSYLQALLDRYDRNVAKAARCAGIDRVHLHRLLRKHHLQEAKS